MKTLTVPSIDTIQESTVEEFKTLEGDREYILTPGFDAYKL